MDAFEHPVEAGDLALKVVQTSFRDLVEAHAPVCRGRYHPLRFDHFCLEQPLQGWIQRAFFNLKQIVGALLDMLNQRISVRRLAAEMNTTVQMLGTTAFDLLLEKFGEPRPG